MRRAGSTPDLMSWNSRRLCVAGGESSEGNLLVAYRDQELLLDFSEVKSVDRRGFDVLERLLVDNVRVMNCPKYIELQIEVRRE